MKKNRNSEKLFNEALNFIPGGVNSPVRSFKAVSGNPRYIKKAYGAYIEDEDDNKYIDYISSFGPLILGHANIEIKNAAKNALEYGTTYGACHKGEIEIARIISKLMPSMEMVRLTNSGTEATMSAIRLARGFTNKDKIIKFEGCYHGHADHLLVSAGSGLSTFGEPSSPGVPKDFTKHTLVAEYNNIKSVEKIFNKYKNKIAAIIMEPVPANMGLIYPKKDFLNKIKKICNQNNCLLIFDEVITGFRLCLGGAESFYGIKPDLSCIGKIIGGGFPVGAFGGRKDIMEKMSPSGDIYQAGTLSGNPVAVAAGIKTLELLIEKSSELYINLNSKAKKLKTLIEDNHRKNIHINQLGSMITIFFTDKEPLNFNDVNSCNLGNHSKFFQTILDQGIMFPPSQYETIFISNSHTDEDIERTAEICIKALNEIIL